jgi:hypothetical protein
MIRYQKLLDRSIADVSYRISVKDMEREEGQTLYNLLASLRAIANLLLEENMVMDVPEMGKQAALEAKALEEKTDTFFELISNKKLNQTTQVTRRKLLAEYLAKLHGHYVSMIEKEPYYTEHLFPETYTRNSLNKPSEVVLNSEDTLRQFDFAAQCADILDFYTNDFLGVSTEDFSVEKLMSAEWWHLCILCIYEYDLFAAGDQSLMQKRKDCFEMMRSFFPKKTDENCRNGRYNLGLFLLQSLPEKLPKNKVLYTDFELDSDIAESYLSDLRKLRISGQSIEFSENIQKCWEREVVSLRLIALKLALNYLTKILEWHPEHHFFSILLHEKDVLKQQNYVEVFRSALHRITPQLIDAVRTEKDKGDDRLVVRVLNADKLASIGFAGLAPIFKEHMRNFYREIGKLRGIMETAHVMRADSLFYRENGGEAQDEAYALFKSSFHELGEVFLNELDNLIKVCNAFDKAYARTFPNFCCEVLGYIVSLLKEDSSKESDYYILANDIVAYLQENNINLSDNMLKGWMGSLCEHNSHFVLSLLLFVFSQYGHRNIENLAMEITKLFEPPNIDAILKKMVMIHDKYPMPARENIKSALASLGTDSKGGDVLPPDMVQLIASFVPVTEITELLFQLMDHFSKSQQQGEEDVDLCPSGLLSRCWPF